MTDRADGLSGYVLEVLLSGGGFVAAAKLDRPRDTATSRSASIEHHPAKLRPYLREQADRA